MGYNEIKRLFDFSLAGFLLFCTFPLFVMVMISISLTSEGGAFYSAERIGFRGRRFKMYKFRTMVKNADKKGGFSVSTNDERVTKIGKILRKTKVNELPQLFNVFKGDMSFVGPRPEVSFYTDRFNEEEKKILEVLPGITDFSSIKFSNEAEILERSNIKDKEKAFEIEIWPEKKRLQLRYVKVKSFFVDFKILMNTFRELCKNQSSLIRSLKIIS